MHWLTDDLTGGGIKKTDRQSGRKVQKCRSMMCKVTQENQRALFLSGPAPGRTGGEADVE